MFRNLKKLTIFLVALAVTGSLLPATASAAQWTTFFKANRIFVGNDYLLVNYEGGTPLEGCATRWIHIAKAHPNYDDVSTLLYIANATGQPIKLYVHGCAVNDDYMDLHVAGFASLSKNGI